jgi:hypothetical protein
MFIDHPFNNRMVSIFRSTLFALGLCSILHLHSLDPKSICISDVQLQGVSRHPAADPLSPSPSPRPRLSV